jgi:HK97 family phage portal protein
MGRVMAWLRGDDLGGSIETRTHYQPNPIATAAAGSGGVYPIETALAQIEWELSGFGFTAGHLPAVSRAVRLLAAGAAQLPVVCYRDGERLTADVRRIVTRPDPNTTRYRFVYDTVLAMIAGDAYWRLTGFDRDGHPATAQVLPAAEVTPKFDVDTLTTRYTWRETDLPTVYTRPTAAGGDGIAHIPHAPDTAPTVRGVSLFDSPTLALVAAAEKLAAKFYDGDGLPHTVLKVPTPMTAAETDDLQTQWADARARSRAAVASGGIEPVFPGASVADAQLLETRRFHVVEVARLFGIPAPLLLAELGGGGYISYANVGQLFAELVRTTLAPEYLAPIEAAWSDLLPSSTVVAFDTGELLRADQPARVDMYGAAIAAGIMTTDEARAAEGWPAPGEPPAPNLTPTAPITPGPAAPVAP